MTADDTVTAKLAEWKALTDGATPGPWEADGLEGNIDSPTHGRVIEVFSWSEADAEFIAASRQMVPALLAAVKRVVALIDEDHCPGGCEHDAIDAEVLGDRIKRALMEQIGGEE